MLAQILHCTETNKEGYSQTQLIAFCMLQQSDGNETIYHSAGEKSLKINSVFFYTVSQLLFNIQTTSKKFSHRKIQVIKNNNNFTVTPSTNNIK